MNANEELAFFKAARQGDLKAIQELIATGADIDAKDGKTALMRAREKGHAKIVEALENPEASKSNE